MDPVVPRKRKSHLLAPKHAAPTTSESQWVGRARDQARDSGGSVEKAVSSIARDFDFKKRFSDASEIPRDQEESGSSVAEEENDDRDDSIVSSTASCSEKRNWEPIMPLMDGNPDNMTMSDPGTSISSGDLEIRLSKIEQTLEEMPDKILEALRTRNILGLRDSSLSTSEDRDEDSGDLENYTGPKHLEVPTEVLDSGKVGRKYYKLTVADVMK